MVIYKTINLYTFFKAYLAMEKTNLSTQLRTRNHKPLNYGRMKRFHLKNLEKEGKTIQVDIGYKNAKIWGVK